MSATEEPIIDDPIERSYQNYLAEPTTENLNSVVNTLKPVIDYNVVQLGSGKSKILKHEAKVIAAKAIKSYTPNDKSTLKTWVSNNLQGLRRVNRNLTSVTRVPERMQLESFHINKAEQEFLNEHDREPTLEELSDLTGFSGRRITNIRQTLRPVVTENALDAAGVSQEKTTDFSEEALEYVYHDEDTLGKQIIENKLGYGGKPVLSPGEVAKKLGLSPATLSRKSLAIALKLQEIEETLKEI